MKITALSNHKPGILNNYIRMQNINLTDIQFTYIVGKYIIHLHEVNIRKVQRYTINRKKQHK